MEGRSQKSEVRSQKKNPHPGPLPAYREREKASESFSSMFMASEMANHGLGELDVVGGAHGDGVLVRAGLEGQLELVDQGVIDNGRDAEKLADGRLGAELAFAKETLELPLVGELGVVGAQLVAELLEIDVVGSGQSTENELAVGLDENRFDYNLAGNMLLMRQVLGGIGGIVLRPHEANPHLLKVSTKVQHGSPCWKAAEILFSMWASCQCLQQVFNWQAGGSFQTEPKVAA